MANYYLTKLAHALSRLFIRTMKCFRTRSSRSFEVVGGQYVSSYFLLAWTGFILLMLCSYGGSAILFPPIYLYQNLIHWRWCQLILCQTTIILAPVPLFYLEPDWLAPQAWSSRSRFGGATKRLRLLYFSLKNNFSCKMFGHIKRLVKLLRRNRS
jgi:hypothetical protein